MEARANIEEDKALKPSIFANLHISIESLSAIFTWLFVSASALYYMFKSSKISDGQVVLASVLFVSYLVLWLLLTRQASYKHENLVRRLLLVLSFVNVIAIYLTVPYVYTAIFMVIWSAALPYFMQSRTAFLLSPIWSSFLFIVYHFYWDFSGMLVSALLFWTFNLFALVMVTNTIKEQNSREKAEMINSELLSTQALLGQAAGQAERVRIARNIHDLLGHHLTALTIHLQIAGRQLDKLNVLNDSQDTKASVKDSIEQCHALSKLLLSDVREAVSEIRSKSSLHLEQAILVMTSHLPNVKVELEYPNNITINDVNTADILTRCIQESITNALKHSQSKTINIVFTQSAEALHLVIRAQWLTAQKTSTIKRNGKPFIEGNGLLGMQERLKQIQGSVDFEIEADAFVTTIIVPVRDND